MFFHSWEVGAHKSIFFFPHGTIWVKLTDDNISKALRFDFLVFFGISNFVCY